MTKTDSLRGYSFKVHQRDDFKCRYCGLDGKKSFDNWLNLSRDHLLPKDHTDRDKDEYIVTACKFCNTADNGYFGQAQERGLKFDGLTPDELVKQRMKYVNETRNSYKMFWEEKVKEK